jgi:Ser-tRNA(Ala) deacylase AlaX
MMQALYLTDSYLREWDAVVSSIDGNKVLLDKSAFYPQGGGQPTDLGKITRLADGRMFNVVMVKKDGIELDAHGLAVGDKVRCALDWERRYKLMRMHTAAHILSAVINKETGTLITGNQLDVGKSRLDFNLEEFSRERMEAFVTSANKLIAAGAKVSIHYMPREQAMKVPHLFRLAGALPPEVKELRIVKIGEVDEQADGGTHITDAKEIGRIELLDVQNKGKNNRRLYFKVV